jgi:hypothetical protein
MIPCFASQFVVSAFDDPPKGASATEPAAAAEAQAKPDSPPAPQMEQSYVGSNQCFICHRPHTNSWSETKHVHAFTNLPERYRTDSSCLKCHVTGFGEQGGYVAGTEKDLLMVGCESCHGPGARHIDAAQRFVLATPDMEAQLEKQMRQTISKTPADSVCIKCHLTQAHQRHPPYDGRPAGQVTGGAAAQARLGSTARGGFLSAAPAWHSSRFNIKTCGGCHYDRYKQWTTETHSVLSAMLPAGYWNDQDCGQCHPKADTVDTTAAIHSGHNRIGAACETCHGPGREHVLFTRRFISSPPLGPSLEHAARQSISKGKPTAGCVQCHVEQSHKGHPEYQKQAK